MSFKLRFMLLLILILSLSSQVSAQSPDRFVTNPISIEKLELSVSRVSPLGLSLTIRGSYNANCAPTVNLEQTRGSEGEGTTIIVTATVTYNAAMGCPNMITPVEETLVLEGDFPAGEYSLVVNDLIQLFSIVEGQALPQNPTIPESLRVPVLIESVQALIVNDQVTLAVRGTQDGCDFPMQILQTPGNATFFVEIFREVPINVACPAIALGYEAIIPLAAVQGNRIVNVNQQFEVVLPVLPIRVYHGIEKVEVLILESFPMQLQVQVSGFQPDGCDFPVQIEQRQTENTITIEIYRLMPADTICTMMAMVYEATIPIEGTFTSGTYNIMVNGVESEVKLP